MKDLQSLIARSKLITGGYYDSDSESNDGDASKAVNTSSTSTGESVNGLEQGPTAEDAGGDSVPTATARLLGPDAQLSSTAGLWDEVEQSSDDEEPDIVGALGFYVDCLMDLVPSMEGSLAHVQLAENHHVAPVRVPFTVSDLARPWVQNVSDKFELADRALVERLGESNWQRYVTIRARSGSSGAETVEEAKSIFIDSGLGSSIAASVASHTSFVSSIAADGTSPLRVPPTPKEVEVGESFKCEICGYRLFNIKNRVDWK